MYLSPIKRVCSFTSFGADRNCELSLLHTECLDFKNLTALFFPERYSALYLIHLPFSLRKL